MLVSGSATSEKIMMVARQSEALLLPFLRGGFVAKNRGKNLAVKLPGGVTIFSIDFMLISNLMLEWFACQKQVIDLSI